MKKFLKTYGGLVAVIIMLLMIAGSVFYYHYIGHDPVTPDPVLSKVVGEYTGQTKATDFGNTDSYAVGVNAQGKPVFVHSEKAFEQALKDYKVGFDALRQQFHMPPPRKSNWRIYGVYGCQLVTEDENLRTKGIRISQFFDLYENSFKRE